MNRRIIREALEPEVTLQDIRDDVESLRNTVDTLRAELLKELSALKSSISELHRTVEERDDR